MLINLGEAYLVSGQNAPALDAYRDALGLAERQQRTADVAYLNGRIGAILADLGRVDEALPYHEQALALARQHKLPDLEGEQLCMLAMAGYENQQPEPRPSSSASRPSPCIARPTWGRRRNAPGNFWRKSAPRRSPDGGESALWQRNNRLRKQARAAISAGWSASWRWPRWR